MLKLDWTIEWSFVLPLLLVVVGVVGVTLGLTELFYQLTTGQELPKVGDPPASILGPFAFAFGAFLAALGAVGLHMSHSSRKDWENEIDPSMDWDQMRHMVAEEDLDHDLWPYWYPKGITQED